MKRFCGKYAHVLATFALVVTTLVSNSTCHFVIYQEPLPETAKRLRKF
ncbi:MAG: cyclic lactone autoinducer peptide [Lachnospiraceae bacterium]|nr:cyclic lactone autoinducer peptide [Lachnospiraceae bacterium]